MQVRLLADNSVIDVEDYKALHPNVSFAIAFAPLADAVIVPPTAGEIRAQTVPSRVPMLNAHLVLIDSGWIDGINAYIDALPDDAPARTKSKARAYFNLALTMERDHPLVLGIPAALGKTEAEVDALFIAAGSLAA